MNDLTYVLPLRATLPCDDEFTSYLRSIARHVPVIVVDGSAPAVYAEHHRAWDCVAAHIRPGVCTPNGKVGGVLTGLEHAATDFVVIADDDVRYDEAGLAAIRSALQSSHAVVPQNFFDPLPWHARWDTARTLVNRATGGDFPGTIGVRRDIVLAAGGYDGAVLFENLELLRSIEAAGGTWRRVDVMVRRRPPTARHFLGQRVRQAYDEFARPGRLVVALALAPALALAGWRSRLAAVGASVLLAEVGRRRGRGRDVFPWTCSLFAPAWFAERAICSWLAVWARLRGGAAYGNGRLPIAANSVATIRRRQQGPLEGDDEPGPRPSTTPTALRGGHRHDNPRHDHAQSTVA